MEGRLPSVGRRHPGSTIKSRIDSDDQRDMGTLSFIDREAFVFGDSDNVSAGWHISSSSVPRPGLLIGQRPFPRF